MKKYIFLLLLVGTGVLQAHGDNGINFGIDPYASEESHKVIQEEASHHPHHPKS